MTALDWFKAIGAWLLIVALGLYLWHYGLPSGSDEPDRPFYRGQ